MCMNKQIGVIVGIIILIGLVGGAYAATRKTGNAIMGSPSVGDTAMEVNAMKKEEGMPKPDDGMMRKN